MVMNPNEALEFQGTFQVKVVSETMGSELELEQLGWRCGGKSKTINPVFTGSVIVSVGTD